MTLDAAKRLILASSGLASPNPTSPDVRHFRRVMRDLDLIQLDSVNVSARTHYWVFFARIGSYSQARLDDWLWRSGEHFEYWAHEASILPQDRFPLMTHRMTSDRAQGRAAEFDREHPGYLQGVLDEVRDRGPLTASGLEDPGERTGPWWGYGRGKLALEWHFRAGNVNVADRPNFHRLYDVSERVVSEVHRTNIERDEAITVLLERSACALGVGTLADIADYYRIRMPDARRLFPRVIAGGTVTQVAVQGWDRPAFRHEAARIPRSVSGDALLSPFDPLIWFRERALRVFGLHYRIEIYVPQEKRVYGYYVLPFLMDGSIVARVDLKNDRSNRVLRVRSAHLEPSAARDGVADRLGEHLRTTAEWLGCESIAVEDWGDLAQDLRRAVG